jgi:glycosyltransferase involved in cell wall biosynthesis
MLWKKHLQFLWRKTIVKIAFDAQPLVQDNKTGVSIYEEMIIKKIQELFLDNTYTFNFFACPDENKKYDRLVSFKQKGGKINGYTKFNAYIYDVIGNIFNIPYSFFFKDRVQLTHFFGFFVPPGISGKKVVTIYDMVYKVYPETMKYAIKLLFKLNLNKSCQRADKIITISEFSKNEIIRYLNVNPDKISVVPCGVDLEYFRPINDVSLIEEIKKKYKIPSEYFLYLGTLEPRKNIERLIDAYNQLKIRYSNIPKLVLAGQTGWLYKTIFEKVMNLQLENDVLFLGYVFREDLVPLLCGAFAFVFPSLYEGFGMPPLESMACGVPVLTSNVSSLPEVVGDAAIMVDPLSIDEISDGLEQLLTKEELRKELSIRGLERAKLFTWEKAACLTMHIYKSLL